VALLQLIGPLGKVEVDQRLEARLNVDADAAFLRGAEQDADAARAHGLLKAEEFFALLIVVNDGDLFSGHSGRDELASENNRCVTKDFGIFPGRKR
jgi:hypothetical protein